MIWFWTRQDEVLRIDTEFDRPSGAYSLVTHGTNGGATSERVVGAAQFRERLRLVERELESSGWRLSLPPLVKGPSH